MTPTEFASEAAVRQGPRSQPNEDRLGDIADAPAVCQSLPAHACATTTTTTTTTATAAPATTTITTTTATTAEVGCIVSGHAHAAPDAPNANTVTATGPSQARIAEVPPARQGSPDDDPAQDPPASLARQMKTDHQQQQQQQQQGQGGEAARRCGEASQAAAGDADAAEAYEREHVHGVYEAIAPHFSATRHKPWPLVTEFLRAQPRGAVGLDVGCGNGKYLGVADGVFLVGSDRSAALVGLARGEAAEGRRPRGNEVLVADGLALPFRKGVADFAISVAVIHHLSTRERRRDGIRQLLECVRLGGDGGGEVLVYVWALEQGSSRRGWDEGGEQDLLVPWVMKNYRRRKGGAAAEEQEQPPEHTYQRYYHLYRKGELEEDVRAAGGEVVSSGYERDNWWAIAANR